MPSLEITTAIGCTLMCKYCPQKLLVKSQKIIYKYINKNKNI